MIYELRVYTSPEGKLPNILARFENHTLGLFEKHGIKVTDFFVDETEPKLYYICEFSDRAARDKAFDEFVKDPAWIAARTESESNGPIVNKVDSFFMTRPPFFQKSC